MRDIVDIIMLRRSIRQYTDQEVPDALLKRLLEAAMAAPSAANGKPWEFILVTDPAVVAELRAGMPGNYNGKAAIVVCANLAIAGHPASQNYWQIDCAAATENILIAATGLGLGTVWQGTQSPERLALLRSVLRVPESVIPVSFIWVGYGAEVKEARTQYEESRVHRQRYYAKIETEDTLA